ncbi:dephospho-CoA kinase domain-containing protein-like [Clavelina lepadiformis]|uniref:dephospho-CoA kinase domain-containing protein-like n=1 Tax=Clavelina lepadiformis TaxID=159417 RepID=UPI004042D28F
MFLVGLTGGIASGKSTVSNILRQHHGCSIIDADVIAREVLLPNQKAYKAVVKEFGESVVDVDGTINRDALANIVFHDAEKRKKLNRMTHGEIGKLMVWKILMRFLRGDRYIVLDVPLLIESKVWLKFVRHVIVVYCDETIQLSRLMERSGYTREEAILRIRSQMPLKEKLKHATDVVDNNGSIDTTKQRAADIHRMLENSRSLNVTELMFSVLGFSTVLFLLWHHLT